MISASPCMLRTLEALAAAAIMILPVRTPTEQGEGRHAVGREGRLTASADEAQAPSTGVGDRRDPLVLDEEVIDRRVAAVAAAAGEAARGDLFDRVGPVLDLPPHAPFGDPVTQTHQRHCWRKVLLTTGLIQRERRAFRSYVTTVMKSWIARTTRNTRTVPPRAAYHQRLG